MKLFPKKYIFLILLLALGKTMFAQNYHFKHFSIENGLSQSQVFTASQDDLGRMWFGTIGGGITIYNGTTTQYLNTEDGLPSYSIFKLYKGSKGIWIGTDKGLVLYDGLSVKIDSTLNTFKSKVREISEDIHGNIFFNNFETLKLWKYNYEENILIDSGIYNLYGLKNKDILFCSKTKGLIYYNGKTYNSDFLNELDYFNITAIHQDATGALWFGGKSKLYKYANGILTEIDIQKEDFIMAIISDNEQNLWIGYQNEGIEVYTRDKILKITQENGLESNLIFGFYKDCYNNIWIIYDGRGASVFKDFKFIQYNFDNICEGSVVSAVFIDSNNKSWIAVEGYGLINQIGSNYFPFKLNKELSNTYINKIIEDKFGNIWFLHNDGLSYFDGRTINNLNFENSELANDFYLGGTCDQFGNLWVGSYDNGIYIFDGSSFKNIRKEDGIGDNQVWDIYQAKNGDIIIATKEGFTIFSNKTFKNYSVKDGLLNNSIGLVKEDIKGNFWFGTDQGISYFNGTTFKNYTQSDGISSNIIYILETLDSNKIIIGTEVGVDIIEFNNSMQIKKVQHYNENDGFKGIECNMNASVINPKKQVFIGTMQGLMIFDPNISREKFLKSPIYLSKLNLLLENTDWRLSNEQISLWNHMPIDFKLPINQNTLSFYFEVNEFFNTEPIEYQFMIEGLNDQWLSNSSENHISYTNIPFGKYTFKAKANLGNQQFSNNILNVNFEIIPPFWKTNWFLGLIALIFAIIVYTFIKIRESNLKHARLVLQKKVIERTETVNKQKEEISRQHLLLQKSFKNLKELNLITQKILRNRDINKIIDTVYENVNQLMDASGFGIGIYNEKKNSIVFNNYIENGKILPTDEESVDNLNRLTSWCFAHQKDVLIGDFKKDIFNYANKLILSNHGEIPESIIYTPLSTSRKLGVMTVQSFKKHAYNEQHLDIIRNIAVFTAIAIDNSEAYKSIDQQKNEILEQAVGLSSLVKELKATNELIEEKNKELIQLSHVVSNTDNSVLVINPFGDIEWINDGFTKFYGYTFDEFTHESKSIFIKNKNKKIQKLIKTAIEKKESIIYEAELLHKSGKKLYVQTTWTPIINEKNELVKLVAIDSDISKLKNTEQKVQQQHKEIKDSINYAKYLQKSIFPKKELLNELLPRHFVYFKPRDVVSGDFYFVTKKNHKIYVAVADCTGHGVPGAMMSILGISKIQEILERREEIGTEEILEELRINIKTSLRQTGDLNEAKDGIDISLCKIDYNKYELEFSGANSPLFLIRKENKPTPKLLHIKPDKQPVGIYPIEKPFTKQLIKIKPRDKIYLFTDGYIDQAGGEYGEKFMTRTFKNILIGIFHESFESQKEILEERLKNWQKEHLQIDDILLLGFEII